MALRSLIPVEDIRVAHVNSEDNSTTYESGVAYKAGTMVTYEGAATDIAEDDTDLPNAAPLKWGLVPNAFTSGSDESGLATRVSALESEVEDLGIEVDNKLQYISISEDTDLFDFLDESEGNRIYCGYLNHIKIGNDSLDNLLTLGNYSRFELAYYSPYLGTIRVTGSGGVFASAYVQPDINTINFLIARGSGNSIVAVTRPS